MSEQSIRINIALLMFRALLLNDDYCKYCSLKRNTIRYKKKIKELELEFKHIIDVYYFWGDIFKLEKTDDYVALFGYWYDKNSNKLNPATFNNYSIVFDGEKITPVSGTTYITIPSNSNKGIVADLMGGVMRKALKKLDKDANRLWPSLETTSWKKKDKIEITTRRLDVYYWRKKKGLSLSECVIKAYECEEAHWDSHRKALEELVQYSNYNIAKLSELKSELSRKLHAEINYHKVSKVHDLKYDDYPNLRTNINKLDKESENVVKNVLLKKFPSTK